MHPLAVCRLNNNKGISLIPLLIIAGAIALAMTNYFTMVQHQRKSIHYLNTKISLLVFKANLASVLRDPVAWQNTVLDPANDRALGCMVSSTDNKKCNNGETNEICVLRDGGNNIVYDVSNTSASGANGFCDGTKGLTYNGSPCIGFLSGNGYDPICPLRYEIKVTTTCNSAAVCEVADSKSLRVQLVNSAPTSSMVLNTENYSFNYSP